MRYKSINSGLVLYTVDGQARHNFFNGVLVVGDSTTRDGSSPTGTPTSGYVVDAFDKSGTFYKNLMFMRAKDLSGAATDADYASRVERVGMGTLNGVSATGVTLSTLLSGWGSFFEAPINTSTSTSGIDVSSVASGAWYEVLGGVLTYNSATYKAGEVFKAVGTGSVSGVGTFALTLQPAWVDECNPMLAEAFRIAHNMKEDDYQGYYDQAGANGYVPRNSTDPASDDFMGYISPI